jgi:uncharacterized membrane protein YdbT with pleckstrin-like domain
MKNEISDKEVWKSHPAKISCLKDFILGIVLLPILIGVYFLGRAFINIYSTEYSITKKTISVKTGLLSVRKTEIRIADIRGVEINRTFWQRIIGTGTIAIGTAATATAEIYITDVAEPQKVVDIINSIRG